MLFTSIKPMLLSTGMKAFDDEAFLFEPKWDGARILLHKQGDRLEAYTRNGHVVTGKFPELRKAVAAIKAPAAILDCEGVCLRGGKPAFDDFVYRLRIGDAAKINAAIRSHPATFIAFDVLHTSADHMDEPLTDRKARLADIVAPSDTIAPTASVNGKGKALQAWTIERDMEGIVAKRLDSRYRTDVVSGDWIKIKNVKTIDAIILGYRTEPRFALIVGLHFRTIRYKPVATVETGFTDLEKHAFLAIAEQLQDRTDRLVRWITPKLCCRIEYRDRTDRHQLLETRFKGFLFDKNPEDCRWTY
ncbi:ATP-dependent DNA ligase [Paenibacillus glycinis]|uniref:DNA ligase n=1 Tax=Paenibacillus glycinis TaxID=2697035 RepID=A0ABW9XIP5_9BACL|nr:DNA ligase [Paenibacillus glycinis]NBD22332.1 DNA ligase [Paenibacillus glycinis]